MIVDRLGRKSKLSRSGYKGVYLLEGNRNKPYQAQLKIKYKEDTQIQIHLGTFETAEEAYIARIKFIDSLK